MIHQLKCEASYFEALVSGKKTFEVRENDRNFQEGDYLALNEITPHPVNSKGDRCETGDSALFKITYILKDCRFCKEGQVIMGLTPCRVKESAGKKVQVLGLELPFG